MKKNTALFFPIAFVALSNALLLGLTAAYDEKPIQQIVTRFSAFVFVLILVTGLIPAFFRPQKNHTLVACFSTLFAFFLLIPFELKDLPALQIGRPIYHYLDAYLILRLMQAAFLLPMAVHVSARFPRTINVATPQKILGGYFFSIILLVVFLACVTAWQRIAAFILLFLWFTFVIIIFFKNLLVAARDTHPDSLVDAQRARVMLASMLFAEIPLWLRPLTLALGLDIFSYNLLLLFQLFIPIGISYAIMRHDLFGIDRVLRRTLAYGAVSLLLLTLYLALASSISSLFADSLTSRPLAPFTSIFIAALLLEPTRKLIQSWLDKFLYPDRLKFESAVKSMQYLLSRANRREEIIHLLNDVFPNQIGAEWGSLKLFPEPDVPPPHVVPAWNIRLIAGSISLGGYWLGPRRAGPIYDADEVNRLNALAGQAALALAYANAYESLYKLNRDLETRVKEQTERALEDEKSIAAYEERQRIARDLHDSVTQQMFGMHLMARGLKTSAPDSFKGRLAELEELAGNTLKEMRLMLDQLRNAFGEANVDFAKSARSECEAFSLRSGPEGGALLSIEQEIPKEVILPKQIADEALLVLREALQNVMKHSGGRAARVEVKRDTALHVKVRDDGSGFDPRAISQGHYGLRGMRERVFALGGELAVKSETGIGTTLIFSIPIPI